MMETEFQPSSIAGEPVQESDQDRVQTYDF